MPCNRPPAACISATASLPRDRNTVISQSPRNNSVQKLGKTKVNGESKNSILSEGTSNNGDPTLSTSQSQTPPSIREIVIGRELPPPTLNRHFSIDGSIASSVGNLSAGSYNMWKQRGCSESNHPPTFNNTIRAGDLVPNPHPNDVLFPLTGMLLWPGNEYFVAKVDEFRDNFLTCGTRSEQARIALVLIQQVMLGVNRHDQPPARFLSKVKTANAVPGTLCSWVVMDETSVLVQLGRAFRIRVAKEQRMTKDKLKKKKSESGEKALKKAKRNQIQSHVQIERNEDEDSSEETHDPLKGLKTLYHIPQDGYRMSELMQNATRYSPHEARVDKALSPPLQYSSNLPTSDGESLQSTESASTSHSSVYMDDSKQPFPLIDHALPEKRQKRKYKKRKSLSSSDADVAETPKLKSKEAAFVNEGEVVLPKGVTVRPSGKWVCFPS